jgi:phage gp29-like protein
MVYTQRPAVTRDDWTPERLKAARRAADQGSLMPAAQLVDMMQTDDRILGILQTRVRGLLKFPVRVEDGEQDEATSITETLELDWWDAYPETDTAQLAAWGLMLGVGIGEHEWTLNQAGRLIPRLRVWHPQWLSWSHRDQTWLLDTTQGRIRIEPDDPKWILYTPFGRNDAWRHGLYRALAPWWLLKRFAMIDWGNYSEAHGNPIRKGTTTNDTTKEFRTELATDLQNLAGITGVALPPGVDVELLEATARTHETFVQQVEAANTAFAVTLLGQNLTTEVQGGSYAAAAVHDTVRMDLIESDEQALSTALHQGPITWWTAFNFGATERVPWIRWDTTPENRQEIEAHHFDAGIVTRNEARARLGLPALEGPDGDELVTRRPVTPAGLSRASSGVRLASGAEPNDAPGLIRGQAYIDRLATRTDPIDAIRDRARQVQQLLTTATSYDEILEALPTIARDIDDTGPMLEAILLSMAAGVVSEVEDEA